ncbi:hypothetical protein UPYG_G00163050 [Umbra pygmaea]|uniref:IRS-type PTB domain-containing protein n=1 Tax=Umbra pygmaea TaxID=75934 RepID=A0ABD0X608_UMBPY
MGKCLPWTNIYRCCWLILRTASSKGPRRLERFSNEQAANCHCYHKVTDLTKIRNVYKTPQTKKKNAVVLTFNDDSPKVFACDSEWEANEWCKVLQLECLENKMLALAFEKPDIINENRSQQPIEQFHVFLKPSNCMDFYGECILKVSCDMLWLGEAQKPWLKIISWPLRSLRRYGRGRTWFTFEAGRRCDSGAGLFIFQTLEGELIYRRVNAEVIATMETTECLSWAF